MKTLSVLCAICLAAACGGTATTETEVPVTANDNATATADPAEGSSDAVRPADDIPNPAPAFSLPDLEGNEVSLADYRGKIVVLEWFNPGCPFVKYAYSEGPLKEMAKQAVESGVVWLSINSGAPGKQGHGVDVNRRAAKEWGVEHPVLMDESGEVGQAYGAKTTPHMYVVNELGSIVYQGALDNAPLGRAPAEGHVNYVEVALADLSAGRKIEVTETKSYGCSVKYE